MQFKNHQIQHIDEMVYEIPKSGDMLTPARIYATETMMAGLIRESEPLQQVINVAHLPGIRKYSLAMPDIHWGYGFPIGGVAATDWQEGVISPGGVGYDINCGVRLLSTQMVRNDIQKRIKTITEELFRTIPTGVGSSNAIRKLSANELKKLLHKGVQWTLDEGFGDPDDRLCIEEQGIMAGADSAVISERALERGQVQLGTLGSGNHFLEIDIIDSIYDKDAAAAYGLFQDQVVFLMHTGSRGFGYQVCDDYLKVMNKAASKFSFRLPDRQLASAPIQSSEGQNYLSAMACAANYAWCNRQVIMFLVRKALKRVLNMSASDLQVKLVYDVSHNIAKKEIHEIDGRPTAVCVHRKGATRAFGPGNPAVPEIYQSAGQPVIIPGDMGRYSYICAGSAKAESETFGSTCHGAGRVHSRTQAKKLARGRNLFAEMSQRGVMVQARGKHTMAEEMPESYKDVSSVVNIMDQSGISKKVARLKPIGVIKG